MRLLLLSCVCLCLARSAFAAEFEDWTDRSGDFTIRAKFVELKDDADKTVVLEDEEGDELEIPLNELNTASRVAAQKAAMKSESPFKKRSKSSSPFKKSRGSDEPGSRRDRMSDGPAPQARPVADLARTFRITAAAANQLEQGGGQLFGDAADWNLTPDAGSYQHRLPSNGARVRLASIHFRFKGLAAPYDASAGVTFWEDPFGKEIKTGIAAIDIKTGKVDKFIGLEAKAIPLAATPGGFEVLYKPDLGFGKEQQLVFASLSGAKVTPFWTCVPFGDTDDGFKQSISWAAVLPNGNIAVAHRRGQFRVFDPKSETALFDAEIADNSVPALSPNAKQLALCKEGVLSVYDTESFNRLGSTVLPNTTIGQRIAFHSDGTEIAVAGFNRMAVVDAADGSIKIDGINVPTARLGSLLGKPANFSHAGGPLYLLGNELVDTESRMHVWTYHGLEDSMALGEDTFLFLKLGGLEKAALGIAGNLPHPPARKVFDTYRERDDLYAFEPGDTFSVDASALPAAERDKVIEAYQKAAAAGGRRLDPNSKAVLKLGTKRGKTQTQEYSSFGIGRETQSASFSPTLGTGTLTLDGRVIWEGETYLSASSLPFFIRTDANKAAQEAAKVNYDRFASLRPPQYVFDPAVVSLPLGSSTVTSRGFVDKINVDGPAVGVSQQ